MARTSSQFVCQGCGESFLRWDGQCRSCGAWNTLVETIVREEPRSKRPGSRGLPVAPERSRSRPVPLGGGGGPGPEAERLSAGIGEVDRVLGGGIVPEASCSSAGSRVSASPPW